MRSLPRSGWGAGLRPKLSHRRRGAAFAFGICRADAVGLGWVLWGQDRLMLFETTRAGRIGRWVSASLTVLLIASYLFYRHRMTPSGGTLVGMAYGVVGLFLIAFLLFQAVRKRWYRCPYGKNEHWVNLHVHAGLLAVLLIGLHAGFRFQDPSATLAAALLGGVALSGTIGAFLYAILPRRLHAIEGGLTPEETSEQINDLARKMRALVQGKSQSLHRVFRALSEAHMPNAWQGWRTLLGPGDPLFNRKDKTPLAEQMQGVPSDEQRVLDQMILLDRQWKQMQTQFEQRMRLKNLLVCWLYLHVPLSAALVVAILFHLLIVAYY